jgi:hypothetical protein
MFPSTRDHHQGTKPKQYHIKPDEPLLCGIALVWFPDDDLFWIET